MTNPCGYCALVCPDLDFYQAYYINDTPELRQGSRQIKLMALSTAAMANPFGTIQAVFAEAAIENNTGAIAATALALHSEKKRFFYVIADKQSHGTTTSLHAISASTIDEAREFIEKLPEVIEIKERLVANLNKRKAFH